MENINKIVILTGAGISAESGIKTFRDQDGLWENHPIEDVATPQGFLKNPNLVYKFYNARRAQLNSEKVGPNPAHLALAQLEKEFNGEVVLITQNVDDLHERAGSQKLLHMHGELMKMRCRRTNKVFEAPLEFGSKDECQCCDEKSNLRPHIVWFGEMPFYMDEIQNHLLSCDLFISIGTSGLVYPAANFYQWAKQGKAHTVELNLEETVASSRFDEAHQGAAGELVPRYVTELLL